MWAEGLDKHVYPHVLQLLESHSFNGHISDEAAKKSLIRRSASNGAGTHLREIRALVRELEGHDDEQEDDHEREHDNTPDQSLDTSPDLERHSFMSLKSHNSTNNGMSPRDSSQHVSFMDGQQQQQQS